MKIRSVNGHIRPCYCNEGGVEKCDFCTGMSMPRSTRWETAIADVNTACNAYDRLVSENERLRKALEDLYGLTHWILDQGAPDMEIPIEKSGFNGSTDIMGRAREALGK